MVQVSKLRRQAQFQIYGVASNVFAAVLLAFLPLVARHPFYTTLLIAVGVGALVLLNRRSSPTLPMQILLFSCLVFVLVACFFPGAFQNANTFQLSSPPTRGSVANSAASTQASRGENAIAFNSEPSASDPMVQSKNESRAEKTGSAKNEFRSPSNEDNRDFALYLGTDRPGLKPSGPLVVPASKQPDQTTAQRR